MLTIHRTPAWAFVALVFLIAAFGVASGHAPLVDRVTSLVRLNFAWGEYYPSTGTCGPPIFACNTTTGEGCPAPGQQYCQGPDIP